MKTRTLIILWSIAILLGASIYLLKKSQESSANSTTKRSAGETFLPSFPADQISSIHIDGLMDSVTLEKQNDSWSVKQRDNFPASTQTINQLLRDIAELKITQGIKAELKLSEEFGMNEAAGEPDKRGLTATFMDSSGNEIAKISFGKNIESTAQASPYGPNFIGRYLRNHADSSGFYAVSELFDSLTDSPPAWLNQDFLKIQRIKTISTTQPGNDKNEWEFTRENENSEFQFTEAFPGVKAAATEVSPLTSLFGTSGFEDIVPSSEIESLSTPEKLQKIKIQTFDNITYDISLQPTKSDLPESEKYLLSFTLSGEPPTERTKLEGETPEDAKVADLNFTGLRETLLTQLEANKKLVGRTFLVDRFTIDPLLKNRIALIDKGPAPQDTPPAPGPGTSATTPPIEIPSQPVPENIPEE